MSHRAAERLDRTLQPMPQSAFNPLSTTYPVIKTHASEAEPLKRRSNPMSPKEVRSAAPAA